MTTCTTVSGKDTTATACGCSHQADEQRASVATPLPAVPAGATLISIPTMDCASEESDIRRALSDISGIP